MYFSYGVARLRICRRCHRTRVQNHEIRGSGIDRSATPLFTQLSFDGSTIGLRRAAAKLFNDRKSSWLAEREFLFNHSEQEDRRLSCTTYFTERNWPYTISFIHTMAHIQADGYLSDRSETLGGYSGLQRKGYDFRDLCAEFSRPTSARKSWWWMTARKTARATSCRSLANSQGNGETQVSPLMAVIPSL